MAMDNKPDKIIWIEPVFFILFGVFHLHRIWAFLDRNSYSNFWLNVMDNRGWFYFSLMGILSVLCISGIALFVKNIGNNKWWRLVYIFGGGYVLFDLFAIFVGFSFWISLLYWMFDVTNHYWYAVWGFFTVIGLSSFIIGLSLGKQLVRQKRL